MKIIQGKIEMYVFPVMEGHPLTQLIISPGRKKRLSVLGHLSLLSESQCETLVDIDKEASFWEDVRELFYKNYCKAPAHSSSRSSLLSLLLANGYANKEIIQYDEDYCLEVYKEGFQEVYDDFLIVVSSY